MLSAVLIGRALEPGSALCEQGLIYLVSLAAARSG